MKFGIDRLLADPSLLKDLSGRRVALVAHPASVTESLAHSLDALIGAGVNVTSAFGPQHGLKGDKQDNMVETADEIDPAYNIPVFSLYGEVRRPTGQMMSTADVFLFDLQDLGHIVAHHLLHAGLQGRRRRRTAGAGAAHPQIQRPRLLLEPVEQDVAAVLGHRRAHAAVEQGLDLGHDLAVVLGMPLGAAAAAGERRAGHEVVHQGRQQRGLQGGPVRPVGGAGDRDVVGAEEDGRHPLDLEQGLGQGRGGRRLDVAVLERPVHGHGAAGQELQDVRVRRRFGLDEHGPQMPPARPDRKAPPRLRPPDPAGRRATSR